MISPNLLFMAIGFALLVGSFLPQLLRDRLLSAPMVVVAVGMLLGWVMPLETQLVNVVDNAELTERLAEMTVIIALYGVGLAIDRRFSFRRWTTTWRLLLVGMPLSIAAVALLGWWVLGLAPAVALLLGAILAPTDPVLASDVQVEGPMGGQDTDDEHDEARFALTSEAGFNDALAFPFVYLAVQLAEKGSVGPWLGHWFAVEVVGKTVIGAVVGAAIGLLMGKALFRIHVGQQRLIGYAEPVAALATLLIAYGVGELVHGWGFLSVFCAALGVRAAERNDESHAEGHAFVEDLEHVLTLLVLLVIGATFTADVMGRLDWRHWVLGLTVLLVVRPVTAWLSMVGDHRVRPVERWMIAAFGVRGVGSIYYFCYAMEYFSRDEGTTLWPAVCLVILLSIVLHGAAATPAMRALDRHRERHPA